MPYAVARDVAITFLTLVACMPLGADDSAVSVAMGGIRPRKEARISMEKERLTISAKRVTVDFAFLNDTGTDVTTEVGFPIPPYAMGPADVWIVDHFRVWVDGHELKYETDVKSTPER